MRTYTVVFDYDKDENVFNVSVPALPGCFTWGRTKQEALGYAKEAIKGFIAALENAGDVVPKEVETCQISV